MSNWMKTNKTPKIKTPSDHYEDLFGKGADPAVWEAMDADEVFELFNGRPPTDPLADYEGRPNVEDAHDLPEKVHTPGSSVSDPEYYYDGKPVLDNPLTF